MYNINIKVFLYIFEYELQSFPVFTSLFQVPYVPFSFYRPFIHTVFHFLSYNKWTQYKTACKIYLTKELYYERKPNSKANHRSPFFSYKINRILN